MSARCGDCGAIVTTLPGSRAAGSARENQFTAIVDAQGYVIGGRVTRDAPEGLGFLDVIAALGNQYPFDTADIDLRGAVLDAEGRALSVLEMTALGNVSPDNDIGDLQNERAA